MLNVKTDLSSSLRANSKISGANKTVDEELELSNSEFLSEDSEHMKVRELMQEKEKIQKERDVTKQEKEEMERKL